MKAWLPTIAADEYRIIRPITIPHQIDGYNERVILPVSSSYTVRVEYLITEPTRSQILYGSLHASTIRSKVAGYTINEHCLTMYENVLYEIRTINTIDTGFISTLTPHPRSYLLNKK